MIDDVLRPLPAGPRPPADGFVLALRDARRRRWRTLRTNAAALTAAAAAVVAAVMPRLATSSVAGLEPARPGVTAAASPRATSPGATPSATPPSAPPSSFAPLRGGSAGGPPPAGFPPAAARPGAPSAAPAPPAASGADGAQPQAPQTGPRPSQPVATDVPHTPAPTPAPPPEPEPVDLTYEDQPVNGTCETSAWCVTASVTGPADGTRVLRLRACRPASDTAGTLHFTTENEADFRVLHDGTELWRWSHGQPDDDYVHQVYVDRWQCAVWSTPWSRTDQNGGAVAPGSYVLEAWSASTSLPDRWWSAPFTVG